MSTATSASDRYAEARAALAHLERMPLRHEVVPIDEPVRRHAYLKGYETAVDEMRADLSALRALVTPAEAEETPETMAETFGQKLFMEGTVDVLGGFSIEKAGDGGVRWEKLYAEAYRQGILAGIQAGWESWEPENAPGMVDTRATELVDIVFDRFPDPEGATFIEVETQAGASTRIGQWVMRPDGYAVLRTEVVR